MLVLVATRKTQGKRKNDFCWATEGELLMQGSQCDRATADDNCGCARALSGVESLKGTTTFEAVDRDLTRADVVEAMRGSLEAGGWGAYSTPAEVSGWAEELADGNLQTAAWAGAGAVLERRNTRVNIRRVQE